MVTRYQARQRKLISVSLLNLLTITVLLPMQQVRMQQAAQTANRLTRQLQVEKQLTLPLMTT